MGHVPSWSAITVPSKPSLQVIRIMKLSYHRSREHVRLISEFHNYINNVSNSHYKFFSSKHSKRHKLNVLTVENLFTIDKLFQAYQKKLYQQSSNQSSIVRVCLLRTCTAEPVTFPAAFQAYQKKIYQQSSNQSSIVRVCLLCTCTAEPVTFLAAFQAYQKKIYQQSSNQSSIVRVCSLHTCTAEPVTFPAAFQAYTRVVKPVQTTAALNTTLTVEIILAACTLHSAID